MVVRGEYGELEKEILADLRRRIPDRAGLGRHRMRLPS